MRVHIYFVLSIATFALSAAEKLKLPVTTCKRNESNYSTCLKLAIEEAWPRFVKGQINVIADCDISWHVTGRVENDTWKIKRARLTPTINKVKFSLKDFFNGDQELNNFISLFINEHWPILYRLAYKEISRLLDGMLYRAVNPLFSKVSFSNTFPV